MIQDKLLQDFLHDWIVGITNLPPYDVRPRWQAEPPNIPDAGNDWCSFGIMRRVVSGNALEYHYGTGGITGHGYDQIRRHETLHCLASFYGDNADYYMTMLREGMQVAQNREVLSLNDMGLIGSDDSIVVPELLKEQWLYRVDLTFSLVRQIKLEYQVQNIDQAVIDIHNEQYIEHDLIG